MTNFFIKIINVMLIFGCLSVAVSVSAKGNKKVQEVNFGEMDLKGTVRSPDGAFLVHKKGIKFKPLYELKGDQDSKIRDSVNYIL